MSAMTTCESFCGPKLTAIFARLGCHVNHHLSLPPWPRPGAAASSNRGIWLGFLVVLAASVMDLLDSTIAQTAAPAIRRDLGGSYAALEWISAAYTLAMAVTLLLGSRLGDLFGRRRVLLVGIGGFVGRVGAVLARARRQAR